MANNLNNIIDLETFNQLTTNGTYNTLVFVKPYTVAEFQQGKSVWGADGGWITQLSDLDQMTNWFTNSDNDIYNPYKGSNNKIIISDYYTTSFIQPYTVSEFQQGKPYQGEDGSWVFPEPDLTLLVNWFTDQDNPIYNPYNQIFTTSPPQLTFRTEVILPAQVSSNTWVQSLGSAAQTAASTHGITVISLAGPSIKTVVGEPASLGQTQNQLLGAHILEFS